MRKPYVKNADLAFGWCQECHAIIGDYPVLNPYWHVSKTLWAHSHYQGHTVRRISHEEAWRDWIDTTNAE